MLQLSTSKEILISNIKDKPSSPAWLITKARQNRARR
jgi:hypothetical protein